MLIICVLKSQTYKCARNILLFVKNHNHLDMKLLRFKVIHLEERWTDSLNGY